MNGKAQVKTVEKGLVAEEKNTGRVTNREEVEKKVLKKRSKKRNNKRMASQGKKERGGRCSCEQDMEDSEDTVVGGRILTRRDCLLNRKERKWAGEKSRSEIRGEDAIQEGKLGQILVSV